METKNLQKTVKAVYEDSKTFILNTYQDIKKSRTKSIVAIAVLATIAVGLLSVAFTGGSGSSKNVVTVNHEKHYESPKQTEPNFDYSTNSEYEMEAQQKEEAAAMDTMADAGENTYAQSPLGNGDTLEGEGIQTQYMKYTVEEKESLYTIAKRVYGSSHYWVLIYDRNKDIIKDPDLIFAGQQIEIPFRTDGNLSWDKEQLVENYIEVYKTYRKHEKLSEVYWLLYTSVKNIDPALLDHYKTEVKKFDRAFARGEFNGLPPESTGNPLAKL